MRIYVSSTYEDFKEHRAQVCQQILELEYLPICMEYMGVRPVRPVVACLEDVASCDVYVGFIGHRYGYIDPDYPAAQGRSITELEYRQALECGLDTLVFVLEGDLSRQDSQEPDEAFARLTALREEWRKDLTIRTFSSPTDLAQKVSTALHRWAINKAKGNQSDREALKIAMDLLRRATGEPPPPPPQRVRKRVAGTQSSRTEHFRDRVEQLRHLKERLTDKSLRLVMLCGKGGMGKTALVHRLVDDMQREMPETLEDDSQSIQSIANVELRETALHDPRRIVTIIAQTLEAEAAAELNRQWDEDTPLSAKLDFLFNHALKDWPCLIVLDNFESILDEDDTIGPQFADLRQFVETALETDHAALLLATSRRSLVLPDDMEGRSGTRMEELSLKEGLPDEEGVALLRELDADGQAGLREAPAEDLAEIVRRSHGIPRTLESVCGALRRRGRPKSLTLAELLADQEKCRKLMQNPARELFESLSPDAKLIMQVLAVYERPVPAVAIKHLYPALAVDQLLDRLVLDYAVYYDAGQFSLHSLDQEYAYSQIPDEDHDNGFSKPALHEAATEFWRELQKPRDAWKTIDDLEPQRQQFYHLLRAGLYDRAAEVIGAIDRRYLFLWGYANLAIDMRRRLVGKLSHSTLRESNAAALAWSLFSVGRLDEAAEQYEEAIRIAQTSGGFSDLSGHRHNVALVYRDLGELERSRELFEQVNAGYEGFVSKATLAARLGDQAITLLSLGQIATAKQGFVRALEAASQSGDERVRANTLDNLALVSLLEGDFETAKARLDEALQIPVDVVGVYNTCIHLITRARCCLHLREFGAVSGDCRDAIEHGQPASRHEAHFYLALSLLHRGQPEEARVELLRAETLCRSLLTHSPHNWRAQYFLAHIILCLGRSAGSEPAYREALAVCAGLGVIIEALSHLELLRQLPEPPAGLDDALQDLRVLQNLHDALGALEKDATSEEAVARWHSAVDAATTQLTHDDLPLAWALKSAAVRLGQISRPAEASDAARFALRVYGARALAGNASASLPLLELGDAFLESGNVEATCAAYEAALSLSDACPAAQYGLSRGRLNKQGMALSAQGNYDEATAYYNLALAIAERCEGPDGEHVAEALNNLASVHLRQGQAAEVVPLSARALEIDCAVFGEDHQWPALDRSKLGWAHLQLGRPAAALALLERAAPVLAKELGEDHEHARSAREWLQQTREALEAGSEQ